MKRRITFTHRAASFSPDGFYRYLLYRHWRDTERLPIAWCMLNPSDANDTRDDPTIMRCADFSDQWGYGSMYVINKFAVVSSDPSALKRLTPGFARGSYNHLYMRKALSECHRVVLAWGNPGGTKVDDGLLGLQDGLWHLGLTKSGAPKHPLYLPRSTQLQPWIFPGD